MCDPISQIKLLNFILNLNKSIKNIYHFVENGFILQIYCMSLLPRTQSDSSKCFFCNHIKLFSHSYHKVTEWTLNNASLFLHAASVGGQLLSDVTSSHNLTRSPDSCLVLTLCWYVMQQMVTSWRSNMPSPQAVISVSQNAVTPMHQYGGLIQGWQLTHHHFHCCVGQFILLFVSQKFSALKSTWQSLTRLPTAGWIWSFTTCRIEPGSLVSGCLICKQWISYTSPCPHRPPPSQLGGHKICRWLP